MKRTDQNFVYGVLFGASIATACFVSSPELRLVRGGAIALAAVGAIAYAYPYPENR